MNIGTSIVILAGWLFASAIALSPSMNDRGYKQGILVASSLTVIALLWEAFTRSH